jgi:hypothetical protein
VKSGGSRVAAAAWRRLPVLILATALFVADGAEKSVLADTQPHDPAAAINMAGRQRMLSQRIVLTYCQIGLNVMQRESRSRLHRSVVRFDSQLAQLKKTATQPQVKQVLDQVEKMWVRFRIIATGPVNREGAGRLIYLNDDLEYMSNKVVQLLQDRTGTDFVRLVNVAGRQRMLSQRLAKFYMMREWGFDTLTTRSETEAARNEFSGALEVLRDAPENSAEVNRLLDEASLQWVWFNNALNLKGEESYRLLVADSSETILRIMDRVTALYELEARR